MFLIDVIAGILFGFTLGLIPSLHINLIGYFFSLFGMFVFFKNHLYFFFSLCISQTLTSIVPSFLFYAPTPDTLISPFLGQLESPKIALLEYFSLSFFGFLLGAFFAVLFLPIFYLLFVMFSDFYILIFIVLLLVLIFLIFQENYWQSCGLVFSIVVFSGVLGIFTLKYNFFFKEPLIPCIFGLFAFPNILVILFSDSKGQEKLSPSVQEIISFKDIVNSSFLGALFSSTISIFPSLSPGLAMSFASFFQKKISSKKTIVMFSSILSSVLLIYFFLSVVFNKHRLGFLSMLSTNQIFPKMVLSDIFFMSFVFLLVVGLTVFIIYSSIDTIIFFLNRFDKRNILFCVSTFSILLIFWFCGLAGVFLLLVSTAIGFLPIVYNKNRLALMSYLIIPTVLFFV